MPVFLVMLNPPPPKFYLVGKMWEKNKTKSASQIPERPIFYNLSDICPISNAKIALMTD